MFQMSAYMLQTLAREFGQQMREARSLAPLAPPALPPPPTPSSSDSASDAPPENIADAKKDDEAGKDDEAFFVLAAMHVC